MAFDLGKLCGFSAALGVAAHLGWFIKGEQDFYSRQYVCLWAAAQVAAFFFFSRVAEYSYLGSLAMQTLVSTAWLSGVFGSMMIYRVFFHQLRNFPGPLSWKLSKLTQVFVNGGDSMGYKHLDDLHKEYGNFVRTGPNEICTTHPDAPALILGPGSKCTKAIWYDVGIPLVSMHTIRDKKLHDTRRRTWDKGFNARSLRDYEARVSSYATVLLKQLKAFGGGKFNASKWFNYYSFDVMGDLAFGESFHMLDTGEKHFAIPMLEAGMEAMNVIPVAPWLFWIVAVIPFLSEGYHNFIRWSGEQYDRRKGMKVTEPDITHHLINAPSMSTDPVVNRNWELGDARLIIVAGSDTTAATLTYMAYELIRHPKVLKQLREEVKDVVSDDGVDLMALQKCDYLNAVIDEVLRLHPPVPSGLIRITPPEGLKIGGTFIPGGTHIQIPLYSLQRSSEAFQRPDEFIPERWTSQPELLKHKNAWAPFSMGPFGCVGKTLAYMEIRTVISRLVTLFDLDFAAGEDGSNLINKSEDHFTLNLADMYITCKPRNA